MTTMIQLVPINPKVANGVGTGMCFLSLKHKILSIFELKAKFFGISTRRLNGVIQNKVFITEAMGLNASEDALGNVTVKNEHFGVGFDDNDDEYQGSTLSENDSNEESTEHQNTIDELRKQIKQIAEQNKSISEQNKQICEQNKLISEQNQQIHEQNKNCQHQNEINEKLRAEIECLKKELKQ